jgi:predicted transcriptional regulator
MMTITINLAPEEEAKLHQKAMRDGSNVNVVAHDVLVQALDWETQDYIEAVEGIKQGIKAFEQGRFRRFSEFEAEQRAKYSLPATDK